MAFQQHLFIWALPGSYAEANRFASRNTGFQRPDALLLTITIEIAKIKIKCLSISYIGIKPNNYSRKMTGLYKVSCIIRKYFSFTKWPGYTPAWSELHPKP